MSHAEKIEALAIFLDIDCEEAESLIDNGDYEVLTDAEADDRWEEELDMYIDDCILPEIPEFCQRYFDREAWKRDARFDDRGHAISRYDGHENEQTVNGETYYIYRQN